MKHVEIDNTGIKSTYHMKPHVNWARAGISYKWISQLHDFSLIRQNALHRIHTLLPNQGKDRTAQYCTLPLIIYILNVPGIQNVGHPAEGLIVRTQVETKGSVGGPLPQKNWLSFRNNY
jgi:hypothetical protein